MSRKENLIWIDLEMTGLNPDTNRIIEIATVVTDKELTVLAEGPGLRDSSVGRGARGAWTSGTRANTRTPGSRSACARASVDEQEAEQADAEFLRQHVDHGASPICGNSICQDRRFLIRHMPELAAFFHYRNLDVSTLKILAKLWLPEVGNRFEKKSVHLALADIHDSIRELRFYREHLFKR